MSCLFLGLACLKKIFVWGFDAFFFSFLSPLAKERKREKNKREKEKEKKKNLAQWDEWTNGRMDRCTRKEASKQKVNHTHRWFIRGVFF